MEENMNKVDEQSEVNVDLQVSVRKVLILTTKDDYRTILEDRYDKIINRLHIESEQLEKGGIMKIEEDWQIRSDFKGYITFDFATDLGGYACSLVVCDGVACNVQPI